MALVPSLWEFSCYVSGGVCLLFSLSLSIVSPTHTLPSLPTQYGGAIFIHNGEATLTSCTLYGNSASVSGGVCLLFSLPCVSSHTRPLFPSHALTLSLSLTLYLSLLHGLSFSQPPHPPSFPRSMVEPLH